MHTIEANCTQIRRDKVGAHWLTETYNSTLEGHAHSSLYVESNGESDGHTNPPPRLKGAVIHQQRNLGFPFASRSSFESVNLLLVLNSQHLGWNLKLAGLCTSNLRSGSRGGLEYLNDFIKCVLEFVLLALYRRGWNDCPSVVTPSIAWFILSSRVDERRFLLNWTVVSRNALLHGFFGVPGCQNAKTAFLCLKDQFLLAKFLRGPISLPLEEMFQTQGSGKTIRIFR